MQTTKEAEHSGKIGRDAHPEICDVDTEIGSLIAEETCGVRPFYLATAYGFHVYTRKKRGEK